MDIRKLKELAEELEKQVQLATRNGYSNASCVLTEEVEKLLPMIYHEEITEPVKLEFTAGPRWNFSETNLGECREQESAWSKFCLEIQGQSQSVDIIKRNLGWQ